jgi:hypothetical protein
VGSGVKDDASDERVADFIAQPGEMPRVRAGHGSSRFHLDSHHMPASGLDEDVRFPPLNRFRRFPQPPT